jgi:hypothetical protein
MRQAIELGPVDPALTISTVWLPDWMKPLADEPGVARTTVTDALAHYATLP